MRRSSNGDGTLRGLCYGWNSSHAGELESTRTPANTTLRQKLTDSASGRAAHQQRNLAAACLPRMPRASRANAFARRRNIGFENKDDLFASPDQSDPDTFQESVLATFKGTDAPVTNASSTLWSPTPRFSSEPSRHMVSKPSYKDTPRQLPPRRSSRDSGRDKQNFEVEVEFAAASDK